MDIIIAEEFRYIWICIFSGFMYAMYYDVIRIIRRVISHNIIAMSIEDIVFGLLVGIQMFILNFRYNDGIVRIYFFVGIFLGLAVYNRIFSKAFVCILSRILKKFVDKFLKMLIIFRKITINVYIKWKSLNKIRRN